MILKLNINIINYEISENGFQIRPAGRLNISDTVQIEYFRFRKV